MFIECLGETHVESPLCARIYAYITLNMYLDTIMVDTMAHIIVIIFSNEIEARR